MLTTTDLITAIVGLFHVTVDFMQHVEQPTKAILNELGTSLSLQHGQQFPRLSSGRPKRTGRAEASPEARLLHLDFLLSHVLPEVCIMSK
jgi:hypothetical protein